ncbi:hypothetical protein U0070_003488 [Myodes glareolus]|uniref:Uncharacterized protein n=1 Tax=Myodes glareolus TaxID=447135 RepID=A0AAW0JUD5_MYOGA
MAVHSRQNKSVRKPCRSHGFQRYRKDEWNWIQITLTSHKVKLPEKRGCFLCPLVLGQMC